MAFKCDCAAHSAIVLNIYALPLLFLPKVAVLNCQNEPKNSTEAHVSGMLDVSELPIPVTRRPVTTQRHKVGIFVGESSLPSDGSVRRSLIGVVGGPNQPVRSPEDTAEERRQATVTTRYWDSQSNVVFCRSVFRYAAADRDLPS